MILIFIKLLMAHLLGDFLLQPASWVIAKEERKLFAPQFYLHILIHGLLVLILFWQEKGWQIALAIILVHGLIDACKLQFQNESNRSWWFVYDQVLHIISLIGIWLILVDDISFLQEYITHPVLYLYVVAFLLLTIVSGIVMQNLLQPLSKNLETDEPLSLKNAGKYIGILERLFVFTFVVTQNWAAIGFLIAAKSVFRFGDLRESRDRKLTEYILIGTLMSFALAVAIALMVVAVQNKL